MSRSNYDKFPKISVPNSSGKCLAGWQNCAGRLQRTVARRNAARTVLVVECYPGVNEAEIIGELKAHLKPALIVRSEEAMLMTCCGRSVRR